MNAIDRLGSPLVDGPWRGNVKTVSTANLTLSGEQTISGVACVSGDRVLATSQTSGSENGPWIVARGAWTRPRDWSKESHAIGALFVAEGGTGIARYWRVETSPPVTIGSTALSIVAASQYGEVADGSVTAAKLASGAAVSNIGYQPGLQFTTRALAAAATIAASLTSFMLNGYHTEGDGGARACYVKLGSAPASTKAWHIQSADGAWWELKTKGIHPYLLGAKGDFSADDATAFQAALDYAADYNAAFFGPPGNFSIATGLVARPGPVPDGDYYSYERGPTWNFDNNCVLKATASMSALFKISDGTWENVVRNGTVRGGFFHQNNLAAIGVHAAFVFNCVVEGVSCTDIPANGRGIKFGDATAGATGFEGFAFANVIYGRRNDGGTLGAARSGTVGIEWVNTTDNQSRENVVNGVIIGLSADSTSGWDGKHIGNHVWNYAENTALTFAFDLYGDNFLIGNQVDGPFLYVARFRGPRNNVVGMKINYGNNAADVDATAALFRLEQDTTIGGVTVTNSAFKATASKRIAAELSLGSGCAREDYRKDGSNYYSNVLGLEPVSIGNCLSGDVLISGTTPTVQANANNIASVVRNALSSYTVNFTRQIPVGVPIIPRLIENGVFVAGLAMESGRTASSVTFTFYKHDNTFYDPGGFSVQAMSI